MKSIYNSSIIICFLLLQTGLVNGNPISGKKNHLTKKNVQISAVRNPINLEKLSDSINSYLKLWYTKPAQEWMLQALPIGNGSIGAMVFGGVQTEHLQFNEKSLWSGKQQDISNPVYRQKMDSVKSLLATGDIVEADKLLKEAGGFSREHFGAFQPFGDIRMEFDHGNNAIDYHRELDLEKGMVTVTYRINGIKYKREYFASYPNQVIVMRITADKPGNINMRVTKSTLHQQGKIFVENGIHLELKGSMPESGIPFCSRLKIQPQAGTVLAKNNGIEIKGANSVVLLLSAKTNYAMNWPTCKGKVNPDLFVHKQTDIASKKTYDQLLKVHLADYKSLFDRIQFSLNRSKNRYDLPTDQALIAYTKSNQEHADNGGDQGLETLLFHYGRYLMIASSRKGALPANLQGLWNDSEKPAWDSDYHTDINLEMNYWINGPANLPECFSPFAEYVDFLRKPGRETAKKYFNAKGFFVNIYTNPWGYAEPRWPWVGASGWLCQNLYDHYLFSADLNYLKQKAYPIMKESCLFYLDLLVEYKDNSLAVTPGVSPEVGFRFTDGKNYRVSAGASIDQQIVYDLFTNTIEAATILKKDSELVAILKERLKQLSSPVKIDKKGNVQEWIEDWQPEDPEHRHISHLYALYPGRMIDPLQTPQLSVAAKNSLLSRGDNHTGWGTAWRIACYARLGDGERAYGLFKSIIRHTTSTKIVYKNGGGAYENLLTCHSPFQIDSNFGYTAAVAEMLLQSHLGNLERGDEIQLLPALPAAWSDGSIKGIMARGGFTVDLEWKAGKLIKAVVLSKQKKSVKIHYNGKIIDVQINKGKFVLIDSELNVKPIS